MVILQFNKLIRNKWVWGAFAVVVSAAFCLDGVFRSSDKESESTDPLKNLSVAYDPVLEAECRDVLRLTTGESDRTDRTSELYELYAAAVALDQAGVSISDAELGQYLNANYLSQVGGDQAQYKQWIHDRYQMDFSLFEKAWRRDLQVRRGTMLYRAASLWVSPMELDQLRHDATDVFTVRVATFDQKDLLADAGEIKPDVGSWYSNNLARVGAPVTYTFNYVEFSAASTNLLAACQATEEEIKARYEDDPQKIYFTTNATGEKVVVKELKDVRESIAAELAKGKFLATYRKLLRARCNDANTAYENDKAKDRSTSLLSDLAKEYGLVVKTVENVALAPKSDLVKGLVVSASSVFTGTADVKSLEDIDLTIKDNDRYALLQDAYSRRVWIVEAVARNAAKTVKLDDCKSLIEGLALADKRDELYRDAVKNVIAKGIDEVLKAGKAADPVRVSAEDSAGLPFDVICQLNKGEISELVGNKVYVCVGRNAGDYDALAAANRNVYDLALERRPLADQKKWMSANLKRLGYDEKANSAN